VRSRSVFSRSLCLRFSLTGLTVSLSLRCIRLSNAAFRLKVAELEGGLETMLAAGFLLSEEDGDTFLRHPGGVYDLQLEYSLLRIQETSSVFLSPHS
jgi:hypothetical protein